MMTSATRRLAALALALLLALGVGVCLGGHLL